MFDIGSWITGAQQKQAAGSPGQNGTTMPAELDFTDMLAINIGNKLMGKGGAGGSQQMQTPQAQIMQTQAPQLPNMMAQQGQWTPPQLQQGMSGNISAAPQQRSTLFSMLKGGR